MTDDLLAVGFFRELDHGQPDDPSIGDAVGRGDPAVKRRILDHLAGGTVLQVVFTIVTDVLDGTDAPIGPLVIRGDGTWAWPSDLAHYVELYDVALPPEFVDHVVGADEPPA